MQCLEQNNIKTKIRNAIWRRTKEAFSAKLKGNEELLMIWRSKFKNINPVSM